MVSGSPNSRESERDVYTSLSNDALAEKAKQAFLQNDFDKAKKNGDILEEQHKELKKVLPMLIR